jgi:hypothetical protein
MAFNRGLIPIYAVARAATAEGAEGVAVYCDRRSMRSAWQEEYFLHTYSASSESKEAS